MGRDQDTWGDEREALSLWWHVCTKGWMPDLTDRAARLQQLGESQEQRARKLIGKLRKAAVHRSGYLCKVVKRWRTGLIADDLPQPPIRGTQHVLYHFVGDLEYGTDYCHHMAHKHGRRLTWNTEEPSYQEYLDCPPPPPQKKTAGRDRVPTHLLQHLPE